MERKLEVADGVVVEIHKSDKNTMHLISIFKDNEAMAELLIGDVIARHPQLAFLRRDYKKFSIQLIAATY